jgi:hypothetical protein
MDMLPSTGRAVAVMNDDSSLAGGWTEAVGADAMRRVPQTHLAPK